MLNFQEQIMRKRWDLTCSCCNRHEWFLSISQARKWVSGFNYEMNEFKKMGLFHLLVGFCTNTGGYVIAPDYRSRCDYQKAMKVVEERWNRSMGAQKSHYKRKRGNQIFWSRYGFTWSIETHNLGQILEERNRCRQLVDVELNAQQTDPNFSLTN